MNIHERIAEQTSLAATYAKDGAFSSAARVLRELAITVQAHGDWEQEAVAFTFIHPGDRYKPFTPPVTEAALDVLAERRRQVEAEGWTPEHDDAHDKGELSAAAGVYALAAASHDYRWVLRGSPVNDYLAAVFKLWPFDWSWFKPKSRRQDKVRAAALLLADIEREDRAAATVGEKE